MINAGIVRDDAASGRQESAALRERPMFNRQITFSNHVFWIFMHRRERILTKPKFRRTVLLNSDDDFVVC